MSAGDVAAGFLVAFILTLVAEVLARFVISQYKSDLEHQIDALDRKRELSKRAIPDVLGIDPLAARVAWALDAFQIALTPLTAIASGVVADVDHVSKTALLELLALVLTTVFCTFGFIVRSPAKTEKYIHWLEMRRTDRRNRKRQFAAYVLYISPTAWLSLGLVLVFLILVPAKAPSSAEDQAVGMPSQATAFSNRP